MQNCIPDSMRGTTNLEDQYQSMRNIPPLLICNPNNDRERVNETLLKNSVLLKDIGNNVNIEGNNVEIATYYYVLELEGYEKNYTGYVVVKR